MPFTVKHNNQEETKQSTSAQDQLKKLQEMAAAQDGKTTAQEETEYKEGVRERLSELMNQKGEKGMNAPAMTQKKMLTIFICLAAAFFIVIVLQLFHVIGLITANVVCGGLTLAVIIAYCVYHHKHNQDSQ